MNGVLRTSQELCGASFQRVRLVTPYGLFQLILIYFLSQNIIESFETIQNLPAKHALCPHHLDISYGFVFVAECSWASQRPAIWRLEDGPTRIFWPGNFPDGSRTLPFFAPKCRIAGVRPARPRSKPGFDQGVSPGNDRSINNFCCLTRICHYCQISQSCFIA